MRLRWTLPGQWKLLDVVDADYLPNAEATEMLQGLHVAEAGYRIQELNWSWWEPWKKTKNTNGQHHSANKVKFKSPTGLICANELCWSLAQIREDARELQFWLERSTGPVFISRHRGRFVALFLYLELWSGGSRGICRSWSAWWRAQWIPPQNGSGPRTSDDTTGWMSLEAERSFRQTFKEQFQTEATNVWKI